MFKRISVLVLAICSLAFVPAFAQTPDPLLLLPTSVQVSGPVQGNPPVKQTGLSNLYMCGASYNNGGVPATAGTCLYAHQINNSGTYAFTIWDAVPTSVKPFTVTTDVAVGIAQKIATIDKVPILVPTGAGISYTGPNTGWSWSGGFAALFNIKGNWYLLPNVRFLKSSVSGGTGYQPNFGILFGWGQ